MTEETIIKRFDAYIKAALRYSLFRLRKQRNQIKVHEYYAETELSNAADSDEYDFLENHIPILNFDLTIKNDLLYELLSTLDQRQRDILYLSICEKLSDFKIAGILKMSRSAVQRMRTRTKKILLVKMGEINSDERKKNEINL